MINNNCLALAQQVADACAHCASEPASSEQAFLLLLGVRARGQDAHSARRLAGAERARDQRCATRAAHRRRRAEQTSHFQTGALAELFPRTSGDFEPVHRVMQLEAEPAGSGAAPPAR